jgi:hypothetical protein
VVLLVAAVALGACDTAEPEPTVIAVPTTAPSSVCMDALITGRLVANAAWGIALIDASGQVSKVLWPNGFHGVLDGSVLFLVDGQGRVVARVGDVIQSGGGFIGANGDPDHTVVLCGEMKVGR